MTIEYYKKNVYGNTVFYIADIEVRETIQTLTQRATVKKQDLEALSRLGFIIQEVIAP